MDKEMEELFMKEWSKAWQSDAAPPVMEKVVPLSEENPYLDAQNNLKIAK